jgi:hypothetical protein
MASEILGLFTSPEEYQMRQQQAQQQGQQNAALQFAQLNPFERANYGIFQGAQQLGSAGRRLFGGDDPQLRIISQRQMLTKDIDPSNPQSILNAAKAAAEMPGQQGFAFALSDFARKAQSEIDLGRQRSAAAERETKQAIPPALLTAQEISRLEDTITVLENLPQRTAEQQRGLDYSKSYLKNLTSTNKAPTADIEKDIKVKELQNILERTPDLNNQEKANIQARINSLLGVKEPAEKQLEQSLLLIEAGYTPGSPDYIAKMREFIGAEISGRGKGKGTQVDIGGIRVDTSKASEAASKKIGEELVDVKNKQSALDSIADAKAILKQGIYAGAYGPAGKIVAKYTGIGSKDKVARTEEFVSYIGNVVIPRLKEFGGNDSEQELKYLNNVMGGNLEMEPAALTRILDRAEKNIQRGIERLRKQAETGETKQSLTSTLPRAGNADRPSEPAMTMPDAAPAANSPSGMPKATKRWNPQTRKLEVIK